MRLAAAFLAGTLCGVAFVWPARPDRAMPLAAAPPPRAARVVAAVPSPPITLQPKSDVPAARGWRRNLFAFAAERAVVVAQPAIVTVIAPQPQPQPQPQSQEVVPTFPYRYIGTFGPRDDVFAVFAGGDGVVSVRPGETIAAGFTLRRIGVESADVAWDGHELRVPLGR